MTSTLLREYARALGEARTLRDLKLIHARFWVSHTLVGALIKQLDAVFDAHRARVAGRGSPADCDAALREALKTGDFHDSK